MEDAACHRLGFRRVHVSGSLESPLVAGAVTLENLTAYGEHFAQARADVTFTPTALELSHGEARNGAGRITLSGDYNHPANDWKDGSLRFDVATSGVDLAAIKHVQDFESGLGGRLDLKASGGAKIVNGAVDLTSLNGELRCATPRSMAVPTAISHSPPPPSCRSSRLPPLPPGRRQIHGSGEWRMEGDYQRRSARPIPRISFATLHDLSPGKHLRKDLPFDGFVEGEATISGPLNQPSR
jgi:hypothetical protein